MTFSVYFRTYFENSSNQDLHFLSQLYPKLRIMHNRERLSDTPVQLVKKVQRFASCGMGRHVTLLGPYSTKAKNMVKSKFSVLHAYLWKMTSNQDGLLRDPTVSKVTHYPQKTSFREPLVQRQECALLFLEHCSVAGFSVM